MLYKHINKVIIFIIFLEFLFLVIVYYKYSYTNFTLPLHYVIEPIEGLNPVKKDFVNFYMFLFIFNQLDYFDWALNNDNFPIEEYIMVLSLLEFNTFMSVDSNIDPIIEKICSFSELPWFENMVNREFFIFRKSDYFELFMLLQALEIVKEDVAMNQAILEYIKNNPVEFNEAFTKAFNKALTELALEDAGVSNMENTVVCTVEHTKNIEGVVKN